MAARIIWSWVMNRPLADLLRIMRDDDVDIKSRIDAAEDALSLKDQAFTIEIVKYDDIRARAADCSAEPSE